MKNSLLLLPSFFLLTLLLQTPHSRVAAEHSWKPSELPNPQHDSANVCGRNGIKSAVCSPDGLLSSSDADGLDGLINFIAEGTNGYEVAQCGSHLEGYQIAVAIIARMNTWFDITDSKKDRAKQFAEKLHDSWGVGNAECQNGVVLFVAVDDRVMYISTGRGTRKVLTDAHVARILEDMRPLMREEQYGRALLAAVQRIGLVLSHKAPNYDVDMTGLLPAIMMGLFAPIFLTLCCCAISRTMSEHMKYKHCREALQRIDRDTERARNNSYECTSCPICLEEFDPDAPRTEELPPSLDSSTTVAGNSTAHDGSASETADEAASLLRSKGNESPVHGGNDATASADRRLILPCGHAFHTSCITTWAAGREANRHLCPVCRRPVDGEKTDMRSDLDGFEEERRFRIRRTHDIYPEYVTYSLMNRFERNRNAVLAEHADFVRLDPVVMDQARAAGEGGSSFSFGGGSSSGGGGGGSSW